MQDQLPGKDAKPRLEKTSELLTELLSAFPDEKVTMGELTARLERRAFGLLLFILAIPNCIPNIPGLSTIFGTIMMFPAVQLMLGKRNLQLPRRLAEWSFERAHLESAIRSTLKVLARLERYVKPRWSVLTQAPFTNLLGLQIALMAAILILPIPLGNFPPGVSVALAALALLQRDGLLAILSTVVAVIAAAIVPLGIKLLYVMFAEVAVWVTDLFNWIF